MLNATIRLTVWLVEVMSIFQTNCLIHRMFPQEITVSGTWRIYENTLTSGIAKSTKHNNESEL